MRKFKHVLALVLVFALLLSCVGVASAAFGNEITVERKTQKEERSAKTKGALGEVFKKENAYQYGKNETVRAIVVLESAPEADYEGTASQRAAYRLKLNNERARVYNGMSKMSFDVAYEFTALLNGFSCDIAYGELEAIAEIEGVSAVYIANTFEAPALEQPENLYSGLMTGNATSNAMGYNGEGMVIAVLDTGLRATHEAFQVYDNMPITETITEDDIVVTAAKGQYLSEKVPFAYDYAEKDNDVTDKNGHGTHISGTALGYAESEEGVVLMSGAAPAAQLVSMKIFKDAGGGTSSDIYFYALEDAYRLGVDVVNMSIGAQNGFTYDTSLETEVFGNIYKRMEKAGIVMCVSAGNEYSMEYYSSLGGIYTDYADYGVVGTPSTYEGNLSIASVNNFAYPDYAIEFGGEQLSFIDSCTDGENGWLDNFADTSAEVVVLKTTKEDGTVDLANGYESDYEGIDVTDKIVVISRGDITFQEKVDFAAAAGAMGLIVCNTDETRISMSIDTFHIPAISVMIDARALFLAAEEGDTLYTPAGKSYLENPEGYLMSEFSNWGTSPMLTIDPTITSVGGAVYSSVPTGDSDYEVYSGTSMAAPNAAGTFACVLQMLTEDGYYLDEDGEWQPCDKAQRMERAIALMASTGVILTDADGYIYSVRKQGAGLAHSAYSIDSYLNAGYIANPIQELGDDKEKTGVYTMELNLVNEGYGDVVYNSLDAYILYDYAQKTSGGYVNTLTSDYLNDYADISFTVDGEEVEEITLYEGSSLDVVVTITLNDTAKKALDTIFPNGTFVEGYVSFAAVDDEGYIEQETHATYLAFYGDWLQAPAMESANSFEYLDIDYIIHTNSAYQDYIDYGYTALDFMSYYTDINWAYTLNPDADALAGYLGANLLDYDLSSYMPAHDGGYSEFMPEHIAITTPESDGTWYYTGAMYIIPNLLRNARHIVMTVADKETGDVYMVDDTEYIPKDAYDYETEVWQNYSVFQWDGTDADGEYLPSGTVATVTFDIQLPYGEATDEWQEAVWSFDITVDSTAPVIEDVELDLENNTLTVTASDEQYLAGIYLVSEDYSEIYAKKTYSSAEQGASFTATFDLSEVDAETVLVTAMDYATNENEYYIYLFEEDLDATVTLVSPAGETVIETVTGEEIELPEPEDYNGYIFIGWSTEEYNQAQAAEIDADIYAAGDFLVTDTDIVLYALYGKGEVVELDTIHYELAFDNSVLEGPAALVGWPADLAAGRYIPTDPYAVNAEGGKTRIADLEDATIYEEGYMFATNDMNVLFEIVPMEAYGAYLLMSYETGDLLATNGATLTTQTADALTTAALWTIEIDGGYAYMYNYAYDTLVLLFDYQTNEFVLFDDSVPYSGSYYPSDLFNLYIYGAFDVMESYEYYTTEIDACGINGSHNFGEWTATTEATCEEAGEESRVCAACGETETREIEATGHSFGEWTVTTEATCDEAGEEIRVCANCGETETREIEATGHSFGEWTELKPGNCTEGRIEIRSCSNCEAYETREGATTGHSYGEWTVTTKPTCTEKGVETLFCANCDETVTHDIEATGHSFGEWTVTTEATCEEAGEETRYCANCDATETREIEAIGHSYGDWALTKAPTCTETGEETRVCANCGGKEVREVEAAGHRYLLWTINVAPTCIAAGEEVRSCSVCNYTETRVYEDANAHVFLDWTVNKAPTLTEPGEEVRSCALCNVTETREIAALECPSLNFSDLDTSAWYHEGVDYVLANGLMVGVAENLFNPEGELTRAMMVTVLYRAAGSPEVEGASSFTDVAADVWYSDAIAWAEQNEVVYGVGEGKFDPDGNVTREQIAAILWRAAGKPEVDFELSFKDAADISDYALDAIAWAASEGLLVGDTNGNLNPTGNATRAQFASILERVAG